eukprot:TRINITY_DN2223_c0_g1_i3.p1 TRINITY_DN2223_c0_g1~~TRINITY_DN2223_c0_g1_i3.p1  ORF type:complete len:112 (-),score=7.70 TRINITY_DN2223_c0_g1_i3:163-498(-)
MIPTRQFCHTDHGLLPVRFKRGVLSSDSIARWLLTHSLLQLRNSSEEGSELAVSGVCCGNWGGGDNWSNHFDLLLSSEGVDQTEPGKGTDVTNHNVLVLGEEPTDELLSHC